MWRRQDGEIAGRTARLGQTERLAGLLGECIANHELTMSSGGKSVATIITHMVAIRRETAILVARLDGKRAAELQRLVDAYGKTEDYQNGLDLALERARAIQRCLAA
jgi:hypothetical protein